jgi:hypothetical protein
LNLVNVVTAGLLATNFFEPLARLLAGMVPAQWGYYVDFLSVWIVFVVCVIILRLLTKFASGVKVRFVKMADNVGSAFFAAWVGCAMVCFTMFTLHTAPLGREFLFGGFKAENSSMVGVGPDRAWLGFARRMALGTYAGLASESEATPLVDIPIKYATRRSEFESK